MRDYFIEPDNKDSSQDGVHFFQQYTRPNALAVNAHIHSAIEILYVTTGSFSMFIDSEEYKLFAGDCILFRSHTIHYAIAGNDSENAYYVLKLYPGILQDISSPEMGTSYTMAFSIHRATAKSYWTAAEIEESAPGIRDGFQSLAREFLNSDNPYSDIAAKLAAGAVLLAMLRSGAADEEQLRTGITAETTDAIYTAMVHINRHFAEDLTADKICSLVGMSYSYFSRSFKAITGMGFKQYLNMTRINQAERLLSTTDKTVTEIGSECGYNNASYFIKVYKELKGRPPREFRKERLNG